MTQPDAVTPLPRQIRTRQRREDIVANAANIFAREGYSNVGMRDIADAVGINGSRRAHETSERTRVRDIPQPCRGSPPALRRHALVEQLAQKVPLPSLASVLVVPAPGVVPTSILILHHWRSLTTWALSLLRHRQRPLDDLVQFAAIQPHAATCRAVVNLDP